ncbi:hypothetical protein D3C80_1618500 [compost metagenome]
MLEETGIGEAEIQEAIGDAVKKLTPYNFNALPKLRPGAIEDDSEGDESYAGMYRGADGEMHPIALLGKEEQ